MTSDIRYEPVKPVSMQIKILIKRWKLWISSHESVGLTPYYTMDRRRKKKSMTANRHTNASALWKLLNEWIENALNTSFSHLDCRLSINIMNSIDLFNRALSSLVNHARWKWIIIMFVFGIFSENSKSIKILNESYYCMHKRYEASIRAHVSCCLFFVFGNLTNKTFPEFI